MSTPADLIECVVNVSEGRDRELLSKLAISASDLLLDVHSDPDHHRSVFTMAGPNGELGEAVRALARSVVSSIDMRLHQGAHPRIGSLDVVPFVSLSGWPVADGELSEAVDMRDRFARWAGEELRLPCFLYGPERTLPRIRREAFAGLLPDDGPATPHRSAGAVAVGARQVLVAYNVWLVGDDLETARAIAAELRGPAVRALGLRVGSQVQVSFNLIAPWEVGPGAVYDAVASRTSVARGELVGLIPATVLLREPSHRHRELGLSRSSTIEARLEQAGLDGGRFDSHSG